MPLFKYVKGERVQMSPQEEAAFEASRVVPLDIARAAKWAAIQAYRDRLVDAGGYKVSVPGRGDRWFPSDQRSKTRQLGLMISGANIPAHTWTTLDGDEVAMNPGLAQAVFNAAAAQEIAINNAAKAHKAALDAAADPGAYEFSTGWPETYPGGV